MTAAKQKTGALSAFRKTPSPEPEHVAQPAPEPEAEAPPAEKPAGKGRAKARAKQSEEQYKRSVSSTMRFSASTWRDLHDIALDLTVREGKRVSFQEVVNRAVDAYVKKQLPRAR